MASINAAYIPTVSTGAQGRIKPRAQVGFLGVWVYRPLTRQSGGGNFFFEITPVTY